MSAAKKNKHERESDVCEAKPTKKSKADPVVETNKSESDANGRQMPKGVCVKVKFLRPRYNNIKEWRNDKGNLLVTRRGRVFIPTEGTSGKTTEVYTYPESEWANPFKLKQYSLSKALQLYEQHLEEKLQDPATLQKFLELAKLKEIGCFCDPGSPCHRDVILKKLQEKLAQKDAAQT